MSARKSLYLVALAAFPAAGAPVLEQPIDCVLGETCYIQNYVDIDPTENYADFACGRLSYDDHSGTDFALPTLADMERGVTVLSAAPGRVIGIRDGMPDQVAVGDKLEQVKGRECGNGVAIDHGEGWIAQYCHMKRGSVSVTTGDVVDTGTALGQVGLSGRTEFPHLHISLRHNDQVVDPFAPNGTNGNCSSHHDDALWAVSTDYVAGGLVRLGFDTKVPSFEDIKSGAAGSEEITRTAPALVLFAQAFGSQKGDKVTLTIAGPKGFRFSHDSTLEKPQALYFRAAGKRPPRGGWPRGEYTGDVVLKRDGEIYDQQTIRLTIN